MRSVGARATNGIDSGWSASATSAISGSKRRRPTDPRRRLRCRRVTMRNASARRYGLRSSGPERARPPSARISPNSELGLEVNPARRAAIFQRLQARNPAPTTELQYGTPFQLLVAVVLSAQATDRSVNLATPRLFAVADTPAAMLALGEADLIEYIKSIGLYRTKAKNLMATCRLLIECYDGRVPREREALESLPGVGR